jgi:hypothetical protein
VTAPAPSIAYVPRSIKRRRRTGADISKIEDAIYCTLANDHPQTIRGLFYQLVSQGVVPKTEAAYKTIVIRLCVRMRRDGVLPYEWLSDNTRWMRKPQTHSSLVDLLQSTAALYRRDLWVGQGSYIEVWCEKDALAGVLSDVTMRYDVPLMVSRGYASMTFLHSAAESIKAAGKPTHLYYFGDYDPSGMDISRRIEQELRRMAPHVELHFERVAVTECQMREYDLPTRPTKTTDSRSRGFGAVSVEVDAIPARALREMVQDCIERHIDEAALKVVQVAEASEREQLGLLARIFQANPKLLSDDSPEVA